MCHVMDFVIIVMFIALAWIPAGLYVKQDAEGWEHSGGSRTQIDPVCPYRLTVWRRQELVPADIKDRLNLDPY